MPEVWTCDIPSRHLIPWSDKIVQLFILLCCIVTYMSFDSINSTKLWFFLRTSKFLYKIPVPVNTNLLLTVKSIHISCTLQSFCYPCGNIKNYGTISSYNLIGLRFENAIRQSLRRIRYEHQHCIQHLCATGGQKPSYSIRHWSSCKGWHNEQRTCSILWDETGCCGCRHPRYVSWRN